MADKNEKLIKMTSYPVEKLILSLAVPSITIMIISALYNMTDTFFVSRLGTSQIAAVGIAFPLMALIQAIGFFFGQGSGNYMARALGARDTEGASRMAVTGLVSGFVVMALIAAAGIIAIKPLTAGLGATVTIRPHALEYCRYILLASPWMVAATILNLQLRFQGSAAIAMYGMLSGAILNMFLDPLFIFVLGLGVKGASIATMISQMVNFVILFFYGTTRGENIQIKFSRFAPSLARYGEMFRGGIPALLRQGLMSVSVIIINHFARPYGDAAIAGISIANRLSMFATSMVLGFGQGFQPVCGFNFGAKLYSRVRRAFWFCATSCSCVLFGLCIIMAIFAPQIITFFRRDDPLVIAIGSLGLRLHCISLPFTVWIIMVNMMTQTMGRALEASIVAFARQGLFLIPSLFLFGPLFGLNGIQIARPVSEVAGLVIVIPIMLRTLKILSAPDTPMDGEPLTEHTEYTEE